MSAVATIVRLRWALTIAAMRKSSAQTVGYVIGIVMGLGAVAFVAALAFALGSHRADPGQFHAATVLTGGFLMISVIMVQVLYLGQGSTLSPAKFALYGIPDRDLGLGLLAAGLAGLPSIMGTVALLLWSAAFRSFGPAAVIAQLVAAPLAILTAMSLSKLVISAATTLVRSTRGRNAFYIIAVLGFVLICQIPSLVANGTIGATNMVGSPAYGVHGVADIEFGSLSGTAAVFAWTPFGAAFQLPFDVMTGAWGALAARVAIIAATVALCFLGVTACLRRDRLTVGAAAQTVTVKGLGAFGHTADSPSGAVCARLFTYLKRDPRQTVLFAMPILFVALMAIQAHGMNDIVWTGLLMSGWFMFIAEGNGLSYDGRGYAMEVIAGASGFDDRRGRVRLLAGIATAYLLVLAAAILAFTGDWRGGTGLAVGLTFTLGSLGLAYAALGMAEVVSVVLMYPVPSIDKPFSSPQGRAMAQGFFPLVQMLGTPLLFLPGGVIVAVLGFTGALADGRFWLIGPVALANGLAALALGTWLGGKLLDARSLSVLHTLDGFASLQK
ncbi:ABC transporter permease [Bifidobacterium avesanii]|uniref:ABC transporter permease n=1 Tax=Bifidobacterium avesanii TaxID=1798157 RepID=A0A7K3TKJ8_9BIFI|nr:ABC transporter permease [Bifidobacterium avesanii]KAB8289597.1 ABC transporter permease [Bifidobacterium avesanii]NEG79150.1 ABC transporter permease [Bifidobacterium avesanii]